MSNISISTVIVDIDNKSYKKRIVKYLNLKKHSFTLLVFDLFLIKLLYLDNEELFESFKLRQKYGAV